MKVCYGFTLYLVNCIMWHCLSMSMNGDAQVKSDFMQMLREVVSADRPITWESVHPMVEFDPRCRAIASSTQKEDWFREFAATILPV